MAGATGLDYAGVRAYLDEQGLEGADRREIFEDIRACEWATLRVYADARKSRG